MLFFDSTCFPGQCQASLKRTERRCSQQPHGMSTVEFFTTNAKKKKCLLSLSLILRYNKGHLCRNLFTLGLVKVMSFVTCAWKERVDCVLGLSVVKCLQCKCIETSLLQCWIKWSSFVAYAWNSGTHERKGETLIRAKLAFSVTAFPDLQISCPL